MSHYQEENLVNGFRHQKGTNGICVNGPLSVNGHDKGAAAAAVDPVAGVCVLVPGIMGWGPLPTYWDQANHPATSTSGLRVLTASLGPISSHHDRACELFAQLKGCRVHYGEHHSVDCGHAADGRDYTDRALVDNWGPDNPVHLVCQAHGANTARYLQHMLDIDFWQMGTSANWIRSISCVSGIMNGSTLCYMFDMNETTGYASKTMLYGFAKKVMALLNWVSLKKKIAANNRRKLYDWNLEHFDITMTDFDWKSQMQESNLFSNNDHLWHESTLQGAHHLNSQLQDFDCTYYLSYTTSTSDSSAPAEQQIHPATNPVLIVPNGYMLNKRFKELPLVDITEEELQLWRNNDGQVNEYSQRKPRHSLCGGRITETDSDVMRPGVWYNDSAQTVTGTDQPWDHFDTVLGRTMFKPEDLRLTQEDQRRLYEYIYARIASLPPLNAPS